MSDRGHIAATLAPNSSRLAMPARLLQRKCACGGSAGFSGQCEDCGKQRLLLQRRAAGPADGIAPPIVHEVLRAPGAPLDPAARADLEPRFGHDFSRVRVHTDACAAQSADAVNALAYTVGRDVVFAAGRYAPHTDAGRHLLSHELTHVVQQGGGSLGFATSALALSEPGGGSEQEANATADSIAGTRSRSAPIRVSVHRRATAPFLGRQNAAEVADVLHIGTVRGTGIQFFPLEVSSTRIGPVSAQGGLIEDSRNRLSVIVGLSMTLRRIAQSILPLWNSATPFTPPGATAPTASSPLSAGVLARALLVYNRYYLRVLTEPAVTMSGWKGGLRFPLPIEIAANNEGIVNTDLITNLAGDFEATWEQLLDEPASTVTPGPNLAQQVAEFLASHPGADERGIFLATRAISNPVEASPFVAAAFAQLGAGGFDVALAFMDTLVNSQVGLLASQQSGAAILAAIRLALATPPSPLSSRTQASLTRANDMLGRIAGATAREMPFVQPSALSVAGAHMIAGFEGFCPDLYDDMSPNCGRGRGNCTIGFGHLVHPDPCDGRASETPFLQGISRAQGEQFFTDRVAQFVDAVHDRVTVPLNQTQFDAIVSYHYNTNRLHALLPDLNAGRFDAAAELMRRPTTARTQQGSVEAPGLVTRRAAERALFLTGQYPP
jgi:GH24 family phage-related lysozyme (muramidase)